MCVLIEPTKTGSCPFFLHRGRCWCCGLMDPDRSGRHPSGVCMYVCVCMCIPSGSAIRGYCRFPFQSESNQRPKWSSWLEEVRVPYDHFYSFAEHWAAPLRGIPRRRPNTLFPCVFVCVGMSATLTEAKLCTLFSLIKRGFRVTYGSFTLICGVAEGRGRAGSCEDGF